MSDTNETPQGNEASLPPLPDAGKNTETKDATFTQADIDRIVSERLARQKDSLTKSLLEDLGVGSVDDAKATIEAKRKADEASKSEMEKLQDALAREKVQREEAERNFTAEREKWLTSQRHSKVQSALVSKGAKGVDDLFILVSAKMSDQLNELFAEGETTPDEKKLEAFIKNVQASYGSYFASAGAGSPSTSGGIAPTNDEARKRNIEKLAKRHGI